MTNQQTILSETSKRDPRPAAQLLLCAAALFCVVAWTFLPAIHNDFVNFDDPDYVTANPHVQQGVNASGIAWAFRSTHASNWHPVTWLSHMLDAQIFGPRAWGHHLVNVLLHAANAVLVFLVLYKMSSGFWRSLFVAALFGLHPLRVESVAWVAERKDVLSTTFWMLTLCAYVAYVHSRKSDQAMAVAEETDNSKAKQNSRTSALAWYLLAMLLFTLGLMSKPMLVTIPFVLLLLDFWPLNRVRQSTYLTLVLEKLPFFALTIVSSVITYVAQQRGGAMILTADVPMSARLANALISYCRYVGKLFWPKSLSAIYPSVDHWAVHLVLLAGLALLFVSATAVTLRKRHPWLLTGWFWYLGTLVPVIGVVSVGEQSMADRYTYVPMIGVLIALTWCICDLTRQLRRRQMILAISACGVLLVCIALTRQNLKYWKDSITLFEHAIAATHDNYSAESNLGNALLNQGKLDDALSHFQKAVKLRPDSAEVHNNVGAALASQGHLPEAIDEFREAIRLQPGMVNGHANLGKAFEQTGQISDAIQEYQKALQLNPGNLAAYNSLGIAFAKNGLLDDAIAQFTKALQLAPDDIAAHNNLGIALLQKGNLDGAIGHFKEVLRIDPVDPSATRNLAIALDMKSQRH